MTDLRPESPASRTPRNVTLRVLGVLGRALARLWGRDVMLYVGGVSFFALLAVFPAVALIIAFFKVVLNTGVGSNRPKPSLRSFPTRRAGCSSPKSSA